MSNREFATPRHRDQEQRIDPDSEWTLARADYAQGLVILTIMLLIFKRLSPGRALLVTFVPGVAATGIIFSDLYLNARTLPGRREFLPYYLAALAFQCLHFAEEYRTDFGTEFAELYGGEPVSKRVFTLFNAIAYLNFATSSTVAFTKHRGALLAPALFFVLYGTVGNVIGHTTWSAMTRSYFSGLYTAQAYWFIGANLLGSLWGRGHKHKILATYAGMAAAMVPLLWIEVDHAREYELLASRPGGPLRRLLPRASALPGRRSKTD